MAGMTENDALAAIVALLDEEHEADLDTYESLMQRVYSLARTGLDAPSLRPEGQA